MSRSSGGQDHLIIVTNDESSNWAGILTTVFNELRTSKSPEATLKAAQSLQQLVAEQAQELKGDFFSNFMHDVNQCLKDLLRSSSSQEIYSGVIALIHWENCIRGALYQTDAVVVIEEAAKCFGRLVRLYQSTLPRETIDAEIRDAIDTLGNKGTVPQHRRLAAVFILGELLRNVPNLVHLEHVDAFLDALTLSIHSVNHIQRVQTAEVLREALRAIRHRAIDVRTEVYQKAWVAFESGVSERLRTECVHGSLLILGVLMSEDSNGFMNDKFQRAAELFLLLRNSKSELIRKTVLQLIPQLAKFPEHLFTDAHVATWVVHLVSNTANKKPERTAALKAIAQLIQELRDRIHPHIEKIISVITQSFVKGGAPVQPEVFECIASLAQVMGPKLEQYLSPILPSMFASEFSQTLVDTLAEIARCIPAMRERVQDTLLNVLSLILAKEPYQNTYVPRLVEPPRVETPGQTVHANSTNTLKPPQPSTPDYVASDDSLHVSEPRTSSESLQVAATPPARSEIAVSNSAATAASSTSNPADATSPIDALVDTNGKLLALSTLATFGFGLEPTKNLVNRVVVNYLEHENAAIRRQAVIACAKLLLRQLEYQKPRGSAAAMITYVLQRLIKVSMTDLDPSIRKAVLDSMSKHFDHYLAQPDFLRCLFLFLYDEVQEIREIAVRMLGRLAKINPGYINPIMRSYLLEFLTGGYESDDIHKRENNARLLGLIIRKFPKLTRPYVPTIVSQLVKAIQQSQSPRLCAYSISALGDIAEVAGQELAQHLPVLLPLIIDNFQDQTSAPRRDAALKALSQVVVSTGYVIEPFIKFPKLLDTILNKIKREDNPKTRCELVRLLGIVGALDPYKHKQLTLQLLEDGNDMNKSPHRADDIMKGISFNSEDYYPAVALSTLIKFLRNPYGSLAALQPMVVEAIMTIFKSLGLKCVLYLKHFMPLFMHVMRVCGDSIFGLRELVIKQLCLLVYIIKHFTRDYLNDLFQIIDEYWEIPRLTAHLVQLIEEISCALNDEFKQCVPLVIPKMLQVLHRDASSNFQATIRILHAFDVFGETIDNYLHLIIPAVTQLLFPPYESSGGLRSSPSTPRKPIGFKEPTLELKIAALQCLSRLSRKHDLSRFAVTILHPVARLLDREGPLLGGVILEMLCNLAINLGTDYHMYIKMIHSLTQKHQIVDMKYNNLIYSLVRGEQVEPPPPPTGPTVTRFVDELAKMPANVKSNRMNHQVLSQAWDVSRCFTKADWNEWIRKFSIALLSESSSQALRSCAPLAKTYYPVARELFNAAFMSCWNELPYELQKELTNALETALSSPNIPVEILQILLNLAEYMEHNERALPIDIKTLAALATKCQAYAKALYYKEMEMRQNPAAVDSNLIEEIIGINYNLQLIDSAWGIIKFAQRSGNIDIKLSWYEKLQKWSMALSHYEKMQQERPDDVSILLGRMRCIHDLGNWDLLSQLAYENWDKYKSGPYATDIATLALSAALNTQKWDSMGQFIDVLSEHTLDGAFYRAITAVHKNQFAQAKVYIAQARELAAAELTSLIGESYSRAYSVVVRIQQLAELEESIVYKQADDEDVKNTILELWKKRLQGVPRNVEVWQQLLSVRSIVEPPSSNVVWWTKFANLVRRSDRPKKARRILTYLLVGQNRELQPDEPIPDKFPMVKYAYLNLLWNHPDTELRQVAYTEMERWVANFHQNNRVSAKDKARCLTKLARWQLKMHHAALDDEAINRIVGTAKQAIQQAPDWYRAWHTWAIVNYKFVVHYESNPRNPKIDTHLLPAISGFIKSIALAPHDNLQDLLRFLTLWFKHGAKKEVENAVKEGFATIHVDKWITVIPQLMARIHISLRSVRHGIHNVLTNLGKAHPQALVFPLTVAKQSPFPTRATAAQSIMTTLRQYNSVLLDETLLVSTELIRVAILWKEKFYKGLDEASRYYYNEKKIDAMAMVLQRLNELLERGAETISEQSFVKAFGKDLARAWELTKEFIKTNKVSAINQAWELYGHVFRTIKRQLQTEFDRLHLKNVSPKLLAVKDLSLAVPGTYKPNAPIIRIKSFNPVLKVISSKQQPRKLVIHASNGLDYPFLLKGHEDLRQDERVMQLFELVNTFLSNDDHTSKNHLNIRRFAVVPLSPNTGVIEWVPHCDTLHELIKQYRKTHNIPLDAEQLIIQSHTPIQEYYKLTPLQKLEIFEQALEGTSGLDLQRVMYLASKNSEEWLDKRTTYTRSLAVMSMVGYILGLGDRHPNNLLLNRNSGQIIHIDFGDCFEVAINRERFAEKVPFRLTRMLVNAMEVCGIDGMFRLTCEAVMRVLRHNADSVLAVLEAFVYDPLINWRLITSPFSPSPNEEFGTVQANPLEDDADEDDDSAPTDPSVVEVGPTQTGRVNTNAPTDESVAGDMHEALNQKALSVIERVSNKLTGCDFQGHGQLDVAAQVSLLLQEATNVENLCQMYLGWCSFW